MIFRPRALPFIIFAVVSTFFMLSVFDSFEWSPIQFVLRVSSGAGIALSIELLVLPLLTRFAPPIVARSRWLRDYAFTSAAGSAALIAWFELVGLTQDRATFVFGIVFLTRAINIWLLAYAIDQISEYRNKIFSTRADLLPGLMATQNLNTLVETATRIRDQREVDLITKEVWYPLLDLQRQVASRHDEEAALQVEEFIDQRLRPLAHQMHPVTLSRGIIPALRALGFAVEAEPGIKDLDTSGQLMEPAARIEVFRWLQSAHSNTQRDFDATPVVELSADGDNIRFRVRGAHCPDIDSLHEVAGLRQVDPRTVLAPTPTGSQESAFRGHPPDDSLSRVVRRTLVDVWQWTKASTHPPLLLILALTAGAIPSIAFIASPRVTGYALISPAAWLVIPVLLALALRVLPSGGRGPVASLRFLTVWVGLGILSGLLVAALEIAVVPDASVALVWQETARGAVRITLLGGAVTLAAELAHNAQRAATEVGRQLTVALDHRDALLNRSRERSEFIAQLLHRTIQGRMSAIALLLRSGQRTRALEELDSLTSRTMPELLGGMNEEKAAAPSQKTGFELPLGLDVDIVADNGVLAQDSSLRDHIRNIVAEAAANARRHGRARHMTIEIIERDATVHVTCTDDGHGVRENIVPGLGSRTFDSAVGADGSWSLTRHGNHTIARFTLTKGVSLPA